MNPTRAAAVERVFQSLDPNHTGKVHYSELSIFLLKSK